MSKATRTDKAALTLMAESLASAQRIVSWGRDAFEEEETVRFAAENLISRFGEAARRLSDSFRQRHPDVPWSDVIGARVVVAHHYHRIDYSMIWDTISSAMPEVASQLVDDLPALAPASSAPRWVAGHGGDECGHWMPRARARCVLSPGHAGTHRRKRPPH